MYRLTSAFVVRALVAGAIVGSPAAAAAQGRVDDPTSIAGVIRLLGCEARVEQLRLRAVPVVAVRDSTPLAGRASTVRDINGTAVLHADITETASPHEFAFHIRGASSHRGYRLGIRFEGTECGKVFWRGPVDGLVAAGSSSVRLEGIAVRTEIEILADPARRTQRTPTGSRTRQQPSRRQWVGADDLQFTDSAKAVRRLRIRSQLPGANAAVIQISTGPFVTDEDLIERYCRNDNARATIKAIEVGLARSGWTEVSIDFHQVLLGSPDGEAPTNNATLEEMMAGAPLYVRAVPVKRIVDVKQRLCDAEEHGAPGTVVFAKLPTVPITSVQPWDANIRRVEYVGPVFHDGPSLNERCYRVVQEHTIDIFTSKQTVWDARVADAAGLWHGDTVAPLLRFCLKVGSSSDGWFEDFVDSFSNLVTGVVDFIGALVNDVAAVYENIKAKVAAVIVDVLDAVGVPCGEEPPHAPTCRQLVSTGMNIALAAAGMPPSLPNFKELKGLGREYVAAQIASQTGLPQPVADAALQLAEKGLDELETKSGGGGGLPSWLTGDLGLDPAYFQVVVEMPPQLPASALLLPFTKGLEFLPTMVMMPTRTAFDSPYQTHMTIPVVLKPNYPWRGYTQGAYKDSLLRKQDWFNRLTAKPGGCVTFEFVPVGLAANVPYFFPYAKQGTFKTEIFAHTWTGYLQPEFTAIRADCVGAPD